MKTAGMRTEFWWAILLENEGQVSQEGDAQTALI
jgi:hypothetical protein